MDDITSKIPGAASGSAFPTCPPFRRRACGRLDRDAGDQEPGLLLRGRSVRSHPTNPRYMSGQMYVEYQIPDAPPKYPIILVHGGSHTGAGWQGTPDGRPGWADFFVRHGWPVYVVDQPGRDDRRIRRCLWTARCADDAQERRGSMGRLGKRRSGHAMAASLSAYALGGQRHPHPWGSDLRPVLRAPDAGHRQPGRAHPRRVDCAPRKTRAVDSDRALATGPRDMARRGRTPRSRQGNGRGRADRSSLLPQRGRRPDDALRAFGKARSRTTRR